MAKQFIVRLRRGSASGEIVANSQIITIDNTLPGPLSSSWFRDSRLSGKIQTFSRAANFIKSLVIETTTTLPPPTTSTSTTTTTSTTTIARVYTLTIADNPAQKNPGESFTINVGGLLTGDYYALAINSLTTAGGKKRPILQDFDVFPRSRDAFVNTKTEGWIEGNESSKTSQYLGDKLIFGQKDTIYLVFQAKATTQSLVIPLKADIDFARIDQFECTIKLVDYYALNTLIEPTANKLIVYNPAPVIFDFDYAPKELSLIESEPGDTSADAVTIDFIITTNRKFRSSDLGTAGRRFVFCLSDATGQNPDRFTAADFYPDGDLAYTGTNTNYPGDFNFTYNMLSTNPLDDWSDSQVFKFRAKVDTVIDFGRVGFEAFTYLIENEPATNYPAYFARGRVGGDNPKLLMARDAAFYVKDAAGQRPVVTQLKVSKRQVIIDLNRPFQEKTGQRFGRVSYELEDSQSRVIYWRLVGNGITAADFEGPYMGNFTTVPGLNSGGFDFTIAVDKTTEGEETFVAELALDSLYADTLAKSDAERIEDTSKSFDGQPGLVGWFYDNLGAESKRGGQVSWLYVGATMETYKETTIEVETVWNKVKYDKTDPNRYLPGTWAGSAVWKGFFKSMTAGTYQFFVPQCDNFFYLWHGTNALYPNSTLGAAQIQMRLGNPGQSTQITVQADVPVPIRFFISEGGGLGYFYLFMIGPDGSEINDMSPYFFQLGADYHKDAGVVVPPPPPAPDTYDVPSSGG